MPLEALHPNEEKQRIHIETVPDTCPVCHMTGSMKSLAGAYFRYDSGYSHNPCLQLLFRCPRHKCGSIFIAEYDHHRAYGGGDAWDLRRLVPSKSKTPSVPQEIQDLSPSFLGLFEQAHEAKDHGLSDLFGMALRKALEFLIKDYAISKHPGEEATIKASLLGQVIKKYVTEQNIKACAERATWLGNDETHYERRWTGHDVRDLQTLILLTMNWIVSETLTAKYLAAMPP